MKMNFDFILNKKPKNVICDEVIKDGKTYICDYRLNSNIEMRTGALKDFKEWYLKSQGIGDLISSINFDTTGLTIIKYSNGYAIGLL